ncbi:hypothetical protein O1L68_29115 [Streptomyces lydicus]|nr:hypothetical protein [Streptomyces lydicus]
MPLLHQPQLYQQIGRLEPHVGLEPAWRHTAVAHRRDAVPVGSMTHGRPLSARSAAAGSSAG